MIPLIVNHATRFVCYPGAKAKIVPGAGGTFAIEGATPEPAHAYAVSLPGILGESEAMPAYVKVRMQVLRGTVAACFVNEHAKTVYHYLLYCSANDDVQEFHLDCAGVDPRGQLMIRAGNGNESGEFRLLSCDPVYTTDDPEKLSRIRGEIKRYRAKQFSHWYYDADLGDGVMIPATRAEAMKGIWQGLRRNFACLQDYFGDIRGWTVLDAPSSAGLHSFKMIEELGASFVLGIDHDKGAIEQATFVRDCKGDFTDKEVVFQPVDLLDFQGKDNSFDLVYCSGLFYHLRDHVQIAKKLYVLARRGILLQSSVVTDTDAVLVLGDPARHNACADWEFAFMPSASMAWKILEYVGFRDLQMYSISEVKLHDDGTATIARDPGREKNQLPPGCSGPIYILAKK